MRRWFREYLPGRGPRSPRPYGFRCDIWLRTYDPKRKTFTEHYEYPELPLAVHPRFRGFHRYDLTSCIGCEQVPRASARSITSASTSKRPVGRKGFQINGLHDRLQEVPVLFPLYRSLPGRLYFHGLVLRQELLQPGRLHRQFSSCRWKWPGARQR